MKKNTQNNNDNFLKKNTSDVSQHHKKYLGTDIPKDYFATSKLSILNNVKSENKFLKEVISDTTQHHKEYLGTEIPEGYFSTSKSSILDKIKQEAKFDEQPKKQMVFYLRPQFKYIAAASLVFILSLTIWLQSSKNQNDVNINIEAFAFEEDVLIESLLIDDADVDAFADATLFNEVVVKAELSEQKLDNVILNSLILEDSLIDDYIDDKLLETIIL